MPRLSKMQKTYLEVHRESPIGELIKVTGASKKQIENFLDKLPVVEDTHVQTSEKTDKFTTQDTFIHESDTGKRKGMTIMTDAAASRGDKDFKTPLKPQIERDIEKGIVQKMKG